MPQSHPEQEFKPIKSTPTIDDLIDALNRAGMRQGQNFLDYMAVLAFQDTKVALKLLDRLLPVLKSQDINLKADAKISIEDVIQKAGSDT